MEEDKGVRTEETGMQAETYISRELELRQRRARRYSERCQRRRDAGAMMAAARPEGPAGE